MRNFFVMCVVCFFVILLFGVSTEPVEAGTITQDFESIGELLGEGGHLTTQLLGLTFTGAYIAEEGSPIYAFWGTPSSGIPHDKAHSEIYTVTDEYSNPGTITVSFDTPVNDLSFYAMDIDSFGNVYETLTAKVFNDTHTLLETITIVAGDPDTGDGVATPVSFSVGGISSLEMSVEASNGGGYGWAFDDLSYTPVPIPGAAWLLGSGLFGLIAVRRGKKSVSRKVMVTPEERGQKSCL
ncbi:MAG: hypothetical protein DRG83_10445 [Deltaproteobacteria bacterium]|nr:MAG: hypothetical protein DRG83_10445 [Deltaproteobacteria bacterium]